LPKVTMRELLEAGVHFGHQVRKWNPKMKRFIFGQRNGIYIIDLQKTSKALHIAMNTVRDIASTGQPILFVGTKRQAKEIIKAEALRCSQYFICERWLGGMLTNFSTIRKSIKRLKALEKQSQDDTYSVLPKKEVAKLEKERNKLEKILGGIKDMPILPGALFIVDTKREKIAVAEARKLNIPIIAMVDTNADPDEIAFPIPSNDDAIRAISLMTRVIADSVHEGRQTLQEEAAAVEKEADHGSAGGARPKSRKRERPRRRRRIEDRIEERAIRVDPTSGSRDSRREQ